MADSPLVERKSEPKSPPAQDIAQVVGKMSDRAIQRVVGGNAFLRGRLYARRGSVEELKSNGRKVGGQIKVRSADEPYQIEVALDEEGKFLSSCTCPGWRGPTAPGHCKHVAAILVALRDRERPPRPKDDDGQGQQQGQGGRKDRRNGASAHVPQTVTVGGKRRRSRRRRRGGDAQNDAPNRDSADVRHAGEAWLPADAQLKPNDFEYRMAVRPASLTITPVLAGSRTPVPIADALSGFNVVAPNERPLMRALGRFTSRGQPAAAEVRGEDAAEIIGMLEGHRVLLEPASMELRFAEEPLKPKLELDSTNNDAVRVRVVFEAKQGSRRFPLSSGAWFEGTPGWHIDTTEGVARPLAEPVTPAWLQRLYRSPALVYPPAELPRLLTDFIPRVAASLGSELPELDSVADLVDATPRIQLKATGDLVDARVRLLVAYGTHEFPIPANQLPPPLAFLPPDEDADDERPRVVRRDVGAEMAAVQDVLNLSFQVDEDDGETMVATGDAAVSFWTEGIGSLPEEWDRFIPDDLVDVTIRDQAVTPQMRVTSGVDWLDLDMRFDAGGVAVDEKELEECLAKGRKLVRLSDGTYAPVDPAAVSDVLSRMAEIMATSGQAKKVPLSQAGRVQDLMRIVSDSSVTTAAKTLFKKLDDIGEIENIPKPRALKATLRDYQKKGFSWLVFLNKMGTGGVLADDMGLGKTLQTIALLLWAKTKTKGAGTSLVVAPTSVVPNWYREIERFAPSLSTVIWQGPDRFDREDELEDADVILTSYALLRRDDDLLQNLGLHYVILDEAQHIKNPLSATARVAKKLQSDHRLALTGTPIENRLSEFWSIVDFVAPGLLGDLRSFEEKVARPIDRGDEETAAKLRATIRPFVLRRTKEEVAPELPEKIEQEYVVPMGDEQAKLYGQILRQVRESVMSEIDEKGVQKSQIQILAALTRLRQVACDPRLLKLENTKLDRGENGERESGKLGALVEIVNEAKSGGHKVLVFSQFVEMLKLIRSALDGDGVSYEYLDGSTKDRTARVDRFNEDPSITAFLISLKAGGTGLNLVGADTVVHFDPWWNPAVEDQATDRAHRIGQTKVVTVYRLIARGSVEEKILQLSAKKRALVENVLSVEGSPLKGLTRADIDDLFS